MQKEIKQARNLINKILKNLKRNDLDWTVQTSISSIAPDVTYYSAQIEAPAQGLQPITWVKSSADELIKALQISAENLNEEKVEEAYHKAEIQRAEALMKFHQEALEKKD